MCRIYSGIGAVEIALIDSDNSLLRRYKVEGMAFVEVGNPLTLFNGNYIGMDWLFGGFPAAPIVTFDTYNKRFNVYDVEVLSFNSYSNYETGSFSYFSDFDVIAWNKPAENVSIEWYDKTIRVPQTVNKSGYQFLLYLTPEELESFMSTYKSTASISINGVSITETELEPTPIAYDYMKVIIRGISSTVVTNFSISPLSTYNLRIVKDAVTYNFYTDYPPELTSTAPEIETFTNETGVNTPTKNISKTVKKVKFYLNEADAFSLKLRFELFGTVTLDAIPILEASNVKPNRIGVDLYEVEVDCFIEATIKW
jgi:hypothetical protein